MSYPALILSILALTVSAFSLGWNIYRDVVLKPRMKITVKISSIVGTGVKLGPFIDISAVNLGPGRINLNSVVIKKETLISKLRHASRHAIVIHDYTNPYGAQMPKELNVGETITLLFPCEEKSFLAHRPTHVGISDTFGKIHWATRKSLRNATNGYLKDFKPVEWDA
ncbi:MAG: hypothetical protein ABIN18_03795 [Pseudomonadota bacterium]